MSTYTVQRGDCLSVIARRFNTTVSAIAEANNIQNVDLIHTGATLTIPDGFDQDSAPAPDATRKLREGSRGADVEQLQNDLVKLGYMSQAAMNTGPGIFGERTRAAVERLQQAMGLEVDGIVGPRTREALQARLGGAPEVQPQPQQPQDPGQTAPVTGVEDTPGVRGTAQQAIDFFMAKGLTREQAAGIAGNLFHESNFSPNAVGDGGTSFGIAQWHAGRGDAMKAWTRANGYATNSFEGQLEYLWHELNGSESNALRHLRQATTAYDAGMAFQRYFERPAQITSARGQTSQRFYEESLR